MRPLSASIFALLLCAATASAQDPVREGLWEVSIQGQVGGQPISSTPLVMRQCINQQTAQDLMAKLSGGTGGCRVSDYAQEGNRARWNLSCTGQVEVSGSGEVVMSSDGFNGTLNVMVAMGGQSVPMLQTFDARRVGDCK
jgi:hypothetical protein